VKPSQRKFFVVVIAIVMATANWTVLAVAQSSLYLAKPGEAQITDNKGQHYSATDAEEMIGKLTGMPIPLNSLRQWILGLPGEATDYTLDDQYRLSQVNYTQNGKTWKVVYSAYDSKSKPSLPSNMELTQGSQRIKLKMDNWIVK